MAKIIDIYPDITNFLLIQEIDKIKIKNASCIMNIYFYLCIVFFSIYYDCKPIIG